VQEGVKKSSILHILGVAGFNYGEGGFCRTGFARRRKGPLLVRAHVDLNSQQQRDKKKN